jgi:hypothetical protein
MRSDRRATAKPHALDRRVAKRDTTAWPTSVRQTAPSIKGAHRASILGHLLNVYRSTT